MNVNPYEAPHDTHSTPTRGPAWMILATAGYFAVMLSCAYLSVQSMMQAYDLIGYEYSPSPVSLFGGRFSATDFFMAMTGVFAIGSGFFGFLAIHQARSWSATATQTNRPPRHP